jgi:dihydropyrimidine dehydrogenase (NAD+) subunit PreT
VSEYGKFLPFGYGTNMSDFCTPLDIDQIEKNFAAISPAMTEAEALAEANRCLYCYDAPCIHACPTHIDVPSFIKKIASGNLTGSARTIFDANPIGSTCARVCPVEVLCEGACVEKTLVNKPIEIGRLQQYATDHPLAMDKQLFKKGEANGKSVGIIGSGPAGLSCAMYLARLGYAVTIYEKSEKPGGLNTYGMAEYKMTQADSLAEVAQIEALGVKFVTSTKVLGEPDQAGQSADMRPASIVRIRELRDVHDVLFIAAGLGETHRLNIDGEDLGGVIDAIAFIEQVKTRDWKAVPLGRNVVVIGAGNTAIDAVTQAKRLGAERVTLVYRRTEKDAPAYEYEMELAKMDGIEFLWQTVPTAIGGHDRVTSLCVKDVAGKESHLPCDLLIKAIGQTKMSSFFTDVCGVAIDEKGRVVVNAMMQTSDPKIFAGGDCVNGGAEAVDAAQMGKMAAAGIHFHIFGERVEFAGMASKQ